jgi:hypothetical protein
MIEIAPMLTILDPSDHTAWCEPQGCFTAHRWYGDVMLAFYSTDAGRLVDASLQQVGLEVLRQMSQALLPQSTEILSPEQMGASLPCGACKCIDVVWSDFMPACSMVWAAWVQVPVQPAATECDGTHPDDPAQHST